MNEEKNRTEERIVSLRFWLYATLTALLIMAFGMYLPLRFRHQASAPRGPHGEVHGASQYHEESDVREGLVVNLNVTPAPARVLESARLDFFVNQRPGNIPVTDLEIEHEKLMHVIGVRDDLNEFFHIHPDSMEESPWFFSIFNAFRAPGLYKLWSEVKRDGMRHTFAHPEFRVEGEGERSRKTIFFGRSAIVDAYQVIFSHDEPAVKGRETELHFDIHDLSGREVEIEPFLAAPMHLAVIKDDLRQMIHAHPVESGGKYYGGAIFPVALANGGGDHVGADKKHGIHFRITFSEEGLYKLFAQFRPRGTDLIRDQALAVSFWLKVEEKALFPISGWWIHLLWSSAAIVILSLAVRRFLKTPVTKSAGQ